MGECVGWFFIDLGTFLNLNDQLCVTAFFGIGASIGGGFRLARGSFKGSISRLAPLAFCCGVLAVAFGASVGACA